MTFSTAIISFAAAVATALPMKPVDGIRDDGRVFSTETKQALVRELAGFTSATGIRLFIETNTYLDGTQSAGERARALLRAWSDGSKAAVVCVDRAARGLPVLHVSADLWQRYSEPALITALRRAADEMGRSKVTEESIASGVRLLMNELTKLESLAQQRNRTMQSSDLPLAGAFAGCLIIGSFIIMLLARRLGQKESQGAVQHVLPEVEVGQRFGAPCGGGVLVEVQYRR